MKDTLLILPCNAGAYIGDYFTKVLWNRVNERLIKENIKSETDLAAVDCIITSQVKDGYGSIVHQSEMRRVKGHDTHPGDFFTMDNLKLKVEEFIHDVATGLKRWEKDYKQIVVFCNVSAYRFAVIKAVELLQLQHKTKILVWPICGVGVSHKLMDALFEAIMDKNVPFGILPIDDRQVYNWRNEKIRTDALDRAGKARMRFENLNIDLARCE